MNNLHHFVHCFQHFDVSDDLLPSENLPILLDRLNDGLQNTFAAFNQAARFSSLKTNRQTSRRNPLSGGIFTSAFPLLYLFQWETGGGRLRACWIRFVQSANPPFVSRPPV